WRGACNSAEFRDTASAHFFRGAKDDSPSHHNNNRMAARPLPSDLKQLPPHLEACEGFAPVVAALKAGHAATVDGAWHSAAPLTVAALARHSPSTILVVIPHPRDLDAWAEDLSSFIGLAPLVFPAWDNLPTKETVLDDIGGARLRLIRRLDGDTPPR